MDGTGTQKSSLSVQSVVATLKHLWENDKRVVIQYGVMAGGLFVLIFFIFLPLLFKIQPMRQRANELTHMMEGAKLKIRNAPALKQRMELYSKEIELVQKRFLRIRDLDQLVGDLSRLAANSDVVLAGSRPVSEKKDELPAPYDKKYLSVSYELILEGGYHAFGKFLSDLEQSEKLLTVRSLSIRPVASKQTGKLEGTVQVDAFAQVPEGV